MRILIVEDEKELRLSLVEGLTIKGYAVDSCADGETADEMIYSGEYDLILLDLNIPKLDGLSVLRNVRQNNKTVNILILTARTAVEDRVKGLDLGANDYLTKPFHFAELDARIRSLLRRKTIQNDLELNCCGISFDTRSRKTTIKGNEVSLTNKETALLEYFMLNKNCIITLQDLVEHVWDNSVDVFSNSVRMHISALRRKLKAQLGFDPIENQIGKGYRLNEKI
ncbi:response regulator transcription factor [Anaerotignum sp.]|uniref:response regulator transcription factor n=1 Tax=Anaerotignum sp. TaxID=2039241 RepID=UPI0028AED5CE|nr:response regulator transcription factor [Anaerotignum sp.]